MVQSYYQTFFKEKSAHIQVATARTGNVFGGGDWGKYRLIPDCVRAWEKNEKVIIRSPKAIRPWQIVLEPLLVICCWPKPGGTKIMARLSILVLKWSRQFLWRIWLAVSPVFGLKCAWRGNGGAGRRSLKRT